MLQRHTTAYRNAIATLAFSSFLVFANLYSVQPMLSLFSQQFHISAAAANWIFASASLGISLCLIPWAILADRFGRRLIILISLALSAIIGVGLGFSQSLMSWIGLRTLQGIALAGMPAVAVAYISEECEKNAVISAVGVYIAANTLGGISGRLVGGFLAEHVGANSAMWCWALLTITGFLTTYRFLPKERQFEPQSLAIGKVIENLCGHIRNPMLWRVFLISGICFGIFINTFSVVGLRLEQAPWHFSTSQVSLIFLCYLSGTFTASLSGKLSQKIATLPTMQIGWGVLMLGLACLLFEQWGMMIVGLLLCSIGFFLLHSLASAWVGKNAHQARALASALYLACYYLGGSLGGFYLIGFYTHLGWYSVPLVAGAVLLFVPLLIGQLKRL